MPPSRRKAAAQPSATVRRLRRRLQEAEDTLKAIHDGHVEALVVNTPEGEQIYTLQTADQPFRLMVEQMREGALTLADDGTILYCNERFAELMEYPAERVTGQPIGAFIERTDLPRLQGMLRAETFRDEFRLRTSAGTVKPAQLSSTALRIDGEHTIAVVVTDLTQERVERALRESNRLKDEFLATLSHELRTPLNVILGWTRMLLSDRLNDRERHHAIELIDRNAHMQAQLVNDLVDMSRVATGKLRLDLESLRVVPLVEAAVASVRPAADAKGLELQTAWDPPELTVLADATRLQQILWNLLSNAVKFTPKGGRISVSVTASANRVRIAVADSGIGIEPSFLPHVFDRFRQADSGTTRVYGGLGLGLAIVHELVRFHGGEVEVKSDGPGRGATFTVSLPGAPAAARGEPPALPRTGLDLRGQSVLLLEDHDDSRDLLTQALQSAGATVTSFGAAEDAYAALELTRPSVIVADIGLPGENGYAFVRRVRAHRDVAIKVVPAIAVTAYATAPDRAEALAAGFQKHMAKPIDPVLLIEAIHTVTGLSPGI